MNTLFMLFADLSLGKVDKHSLSQQTLLELLTEGISNTGQLHRYNGTPEDISEWRDLKFDEIDAIIEIAWSYKSLSGSIALEWLPLAVKTVRLVGNHLSGSVNLSCLPDVLELLSLSQNQFEGSVDLTHLPPNLQKLFLYHNNFSGETDFSQLPKSLEVLFVAYTKLKGEIYEFDGDLMVFQSNVKDMREGYQ